MRTSAFHTIADPEQFKMQLLGWAQQFREVVFLDSNNYPQKYSSFDCVLAADALTSLTTGDKAFEQLKQYQQATSDYLFGYLSYDLKNELEKLTSKNFDGLNFPDLFFFQPKKLFFLKGNSLEICYLNMCSDECETDLEEILNFRTAAILAAPLKLEQRIPKSDYLLKVNEMKRHIAKGDIYEANFCCEFYAENAELSPLQAYFDLNSLSAPPFAAFLKNSSNYLLSASPERFLRKHGSKIISQPIKGTAKRSSAPMEDAAISEALSQNEKERSENIMIVDLVRNDLSKTALPDTVQVEELCGVYTFRQVHHLISTIVSHSDQNPVDIISKAFPMGSMTGAPKISAMKIIDELEETRRGLYSGAIGYFSPAGDFDFNVVIRSILYSEKNKYVSFSVGSAITHKSDPEAEYEECLVKAAAMLRVLGSTE